MITKRKDKYEIELRTKKNIGDETFARELLKHWCNRIDPKLRPDRFDLGEPIRRMFSNEGVNAAVRMWVDNKMPVMLKRTSSPRFTVSMSWREHRGLDKREFPWDCLVWLDVSAGDHLALELFRFLIQYFEPAFGFISTSQDLREKHFVTFKDRVGQVETFVGLKDVGKIFPGVYWATYFGSWSIDKIGKANFQTLRPYKTESVGDGLLVLAYPSCLEARTSAAQQAEGNIKQHLGQELFFDKASVDIESMRISPEDAKIIEAKIAEKKHRNSDNQ
jgi:hypothetical protein